MSFPKSLDVARNVDLPTPEPDSPNRPRRPYRFSTLCANVENPNHKDQYGASSVPIYQTATFKGVGGEYDYSRSGNPTRTYLEHHIAKISSAAHAFAVSSGMAALDSILRLLRPADAIIAGDDLYGGTNRLLSYLQNHQGIIVYHVDTTEPSALTPHLHPKNNIAMVLLESPTNPLLKIVDLATIAKDVKERCPDAIIVVDNTMMSPALQRPLEHGADIVYDSATKYLSGHHDLMAGKIAFTINATGNALTPFDSFLLLRGTKTLALRLTQQSQTATLVANYLYSLGFPTLYPGLPDHPNRDIHERISSGHGAVLSFTTGDKDVSERIVAGTRLWAVSVSFGCVNSLISMPCAMSHASIPAAVRAARGLPEDLIRLCVGIEDSTDLLDDLERALIDAGAIRRTPQGVERVRTTIDEAVAKLVLGNQTSQDEDVELQPHERQWVVSSPGKVILFGEHAVVYGMPALAASVSLRCYAIATPHLSSRTVGVHFIDIEAGDKEGGFGYEWDIDSLPWGAVPVASQASEVPLDLEFLEEISRVALPEASGSHACQASLAFLYLYMVFVKELESTARPSFTLSVRATLPVGAGLGSSAAFSVCTATSLMLITGRISLPSPSDPGPSSSRQQPDRLSKSLADTLPYTVGDFCIRNPIPSEGKEGGMVSIEGFTSHRFLLTDTRVPRNTKELVGSVGKQKVEEPERVGKVLNDIQVVVEKASSVLSGSGGKESLAALIDENHRLLDRLRVSHPSLEAVRRITGADPYNLATKLTGAGGGGCAVTLIPDGFSSSKLTPLISALESEQFTSETFRTYLTEVGGLGLGILSRLSNTSGLPTPPTHESPADSNTLETTFASTSKEELRGWIEALGKWAYV
ncbi:Cys/Met metabolism PLP-dependent enzyme-domain-containing protein [Boletus reticuloceps]|uniref:Cystathionine beta-lyase n=1 Tax=Boletus reticuloceps TaxID=495285 RepID=A0A8I2YL81_9AGAM|nr:Cys/Met metabolism PLP-dependent enzyme-domain-containing protein [Boletus reticuloceps]